jgi:sulfur transfer protein SufE
VINHGYFEIILGILVISCTSNVWANSECNPAKCRHLRERLEKLETVVRGLISIVANKKTEEELTEILALSASLDSSKNSTVRSGKRA